MLGPSNWRQLYYCPQVRHVRGNRGLAVPVILFPGHLFYYTTDFRLSLTPNGFGGCASQGAPVSMRY